MPTPRMLRLRRRRAGALLLLAWLHAAAGAGESWFVRAWQTDDGLPDNAVVGVAQTPDGFLWVATQGGLARFDGIQFREFASVSEIPAPSGLMHALGVDSRGRVWVARDGGLLVCLDRGRPTTHTLQQSSSNARAVSVVEDHDGAIWAAYPTAAGRAVCVRDGSLRSYNTNDGLPASRTLQLCRDRDRRVWFLADQQLGFFAASRFQTVTAIPGAQCIAGAAAGGIWVAGGNRLARLTDRGELHAAAGLPVTRSNLLITALWEDRRRALWIGTGDSGLFRHDGTQAVAVAVSHREVLSVTGDRAGNVWVGTRGGGLNRVQPAIVEAAEIDPAAPFEAVRSVCQDRDGVMWAVGRSGRVSRNNGHGWATLMPADGWTARDAMSVAPAVEGGVWIGTHFNGLFRWHHRVVAAVSQLDGLAGNFARSLLASPDGDLWIGTASSNGLHRLRQGRLQSFELPGQSGLIRAMALDARGQFWAGTAGGHLLRVAGDRVIDETSRSIPRLHTIRCLHATPDGSLWIGYGGSGVGRWQDGRFSQFRTAQGIRDDYISQILDDGAGRLWFAGNRGVFCVRQQDFEDQSAGRIARVRPVVFGREEGLPVLQASREAWPGRWRSTDGRLWFAMQTGLAVVHPDRTRNGPAPGVVLESVTVDGRALAVYDAEPSPNSGGDPPLPLNLHATGPAVLRIPPGTGQLAIELTAPGGHTPRQVSFRYRLAGGERDWDEVGTRRTVYLDHLPPGHYGLYVEAAAAGGDWSGGGPLLTLEVQPFFWQTWWFRLLAGLTLAAGIAGTVRLWILRRTRFQLEHAERAGALERERGRIANDIHDDLGASLTEITLLSELAQGSDAPPAEVQADIRRIAAKARSLTRALDATVWAVNPRNDTLESLVTYLCAYAEDYLQLAGIRCRLEVPAKLPARPVSAEVRHHLFLLAKEALHNVVKHAGASEVHLRVETRPDGVSLSIIDNGCGLPPYADRANASCSAETPARNRQGSGLSSLRERAQHLRGRLELGRAAGGGTIVAIDVPLPEPRTMNQER